MKDWNRKNLENQMAWAALRYCVDGYNYIDIETLACMPSIAQEKADSVDKQCGPAWVAGNKQIKVVEIEIKIK